MPNQKNPFIIDVHTHIQGRETWDHFLQEMVENDVLIAFVSSLGTEGWPQFPDAETVRNANKLAREFCEYANGMAFWMGYVNPQLDNAIEELERCAEEGCRGVKLWISLRDPETGSLDKVPPILKRAGELGLPVKIHTFQRTDENLPGEVTMVQVAQLARQCPGTKIIAAHAGCNWRQSIGVGARLKNLYVDLSGGMPISDMLSSLSDSIGESHVLFGSDALGRSFASQIAKVAECYYIYSDNSRAEPILFGNAMRLFNITEKEIKKAREAASRIELRETLEVNIPKEDNSVFAGDMPWGDYDSIHMDELYIDMGENGIDISYVANAKSIYCQDLINVNEDFWDDYGDRRAYRLLATLCPLFVNWSETIDAASKFKRGIVMPYLHNWDLSSPEYQPFFQKCADMKMALWISTQVGDYRFRHPGLSTRPVTQAELLRFLDTAPKNQYVILGANKLDVMAGLAKKRPDVKFDISRLLDTTDGLRDVVEKFGDSKLVFGSEAPIRDLRSNLVTLNFITNMTFDDELEI